MRWDGRNSCEGVARRVLFVCSMGQLRSPTAAFVTQKEYGWNTRSAGTESAALIPVTDRLLEWADVVYCMDKRHKAELCRVFKTFPKALFKVLNIPDIYNRMDEELQQLILEKVNS